MATNNNPTNDTVVKVSAEFKADFAALLKKYKCEVRVQETAHGYDMTVDGIVFEFDGIYDDDDTANRLYFEVNIGTWANADNV
jgi:hypothetical protein